MSGLVMGLAFEMPITDNFGRGEKFVLLAYADNAQQDGRNIYPSIELICKKTGYSERQVQTLTRRLEKSGYLVADGVGPRGTNKWRIPVVHTQSGGAKIAPCQELHPPSNEKTTMSKTAPEGTAPEGTAPEGTAPELKVVAVKKEKKKNGNVFSKELQKKLTDLGIFKSIWNEIEEKLNHGYATEDDIIALIAWSKNQYPRSRKQSAQSFVLRLRDGSKAPSDYYPQEYETEQDEYINDDLIPPEILFVEPDESVSEPIGDGHISAMQAWKMVKEQLTLDMTRAAFDQWVGDTQPKSYADGVLKIAVQSAYARDWLESRLSSTVSRLLVGIANRSVDVQFVVAQGVGNG